MDCIASRLLYATLLTLLRKKIVPCPPQPSPTSVATFIEYLVPPLSAEKGVTLFLYLSHLCIPRLAVEVAFQAAMCHIVFFFHKQLYMQILTAMNHWSDSIFLFSEAP